MHNSNRWSGNRTIIIRLLVLILKMDLERVQITLKTHKNISLLSGKMRCKEVPNKGDTKRSACLEVQWRQEEESMVKPFIQTDNIWPHLLMVAHLVKIMIIKKLLEWKLLEEIWHKFSITNLVMKIYRPQTIEIFNTKSD